MRILPLLLFVCFVLYELLQVEGKSKENVVKKLLQKYIHHHKHRHEHKNHHHHVHHHHKHHHHHHHHPHHKHWHHHHHHHKSFHRKLVEKLKKEKQQKHQQNAVNQKATKRESLPQLLVTLGKGFMQLGKHLGNNESHADIQAKGTAIKHVPTPKPLVDDHVATTQAGNAFATPSPTSQYYSDNDDSDDIGGDALTSAPPTPTVFQKFTSLNSDSPESNYRERTVARPNNIVSPIITSTPQSKPSSSPSSKTQNTFSRKSNDKHVSKILRSNPDHSVIPKMPSGSDKENETVTSKDGLDKAKSIDEHRDSSKPKIPMVEKEESIPNPSIEIPAEQARLLEHSPTESAIDGKEESSPSEHFATLQTSNENSSPYLYVSESNIDENSDPLAINATQNDDKVLVPDREDDISSNDGTKASLTVSTTAESLNTDEHAPGSIDNPNGDPPKGLNSTKSQEKAPIVETQSEDFQSKENIDGSLSATASDNNSSKETKAKVNSTASDEIMDGEVPPTAVENDHNSMDDIPSNATLKSNIQPIDADAKSFSQNSDIHMDIRPANPSTIPESETTVLGGTTQPSRQDSNIDNQESQESSENSDEASQATSNSDYDVEPKSNSKHCDNTTDQKVQRTTCIGSTRKELAREPTKEYNRTTDPLNSKATTQPGSTKDELARKPTQEYDSIMEGESQPTSQAFNSIYGSVQPSNHGDDDITGGVAKASSHVNEAVKDTPVSTLNINDTARVTELATPFSETYDDAKSSDLEDFKTEKGVEISQVRSNQDSESFKDSPQTSPMSNGTIAVGDSGYSTSETTTEPNHQSKMITGLTPLQSRDQKSDDFVGGTLHQAPIYQTNTTSGSQEYDDTEGNAAQLSDVPVDEAFNPTGGHSNMEEDQNKVTSYVLNNHRENQEKFTSLSSEIEDGEVLPPTDNVT